MGKCAETLMLLTFVAVLTNCHVATGQAVQSQAVPLSEAILARVPVDYRDEARKAIRENNDDQQRLAKMPDEQLAAEMIQDLANNSGAIGFLLVHLEKEPSPKLRSQIIRSMLGYWQSHPEEQQILERHLVSDPDAGVSLEALAVLRSVRIGTLDNALRTRVDEAEASGDLAGLPKLYDEDKQRIRQHYKTMLPAFLEIPPPLFLVEPLDKQIRVLAFGDFGTGSEAQKQTAAAMVEYNKTHPFDFGLTLGDNFYYHGMVSPSDPRWQTQWEQIYGPLGIKFYAILGNHDWASADSPAAELLYSEKSSTWRMPAPYYTFTAGPVQFFAFDTPMMDETELKWLDEALSKSTVRWKVVYGHYQIFSSGFGDFKEMIVQLLPILEKHHVDIYLCGHSHTLEALKPEGGVHFFVSGGGGDTLMNVNPYDRSIYGQKMNGFTVLNADAHHFKVSFIGTDGKELYQDTLTK
jgi:tartrate-resistant acid phosphatase type 5